MSRAGVAVMSSGGRLGSASQAGNSGSGGSAGPIIPASARKVVQSLKEIVGNSDEEIYAMLKECNMDPNETVQRLLTQDPFHEVKSKREKRKEVVHSASNKSSSEVRQSYSGTRDSRTGGERGAGRGSSSSRYSNDYGGSRGRLSKETGMQQRSSSPSRAVPATAVSFVYNQPKVTPTSTSSIGLASTPAPSSLPGLPNGTSVYSRISPAPQGSWGAGSGHPTMADILKSNTVHAPSPPVMLPSSGSVESQQIPSANGLSFASELYTLSSDHPNQHHIGTPKRDAGAVIGQGIVGEQPQPSSDLTSLSAQPQPGRTSDLHINLPTEREARLSQSSSSPVSVRQDQIADGSIPEDIGASAQDHESEMASISMPENSALDSISVKDQFYQQSHISQKAGLEWKPKTTAHSTPNSGGNIGTPNISVLAETTSSVPASSPRERALLSETTSKLQALNVQDDHPVIIPNHFQVPEAARSCLSFGSFGASPRSSLSAGFNGEELKQGSISAADDSSRAESLVDEPTSSVSNASTPNQAYVQQLSTSINSFTSSNDVVATKSMPPLASQSELFKPDPVVQSPQYSYLPTVPNYPGFNLVPQVSGAQYPYEAAESQSQDLPRLSTIGTQSYADQAASYYSPAFRPSSDADARYQQFLPKYSANLGLASQSISSQETVNAGVLSSTTAAAQTPQVSNTQAMSTLPQGLPMPFSGQPAAVPGQHYAGIFNYWHPSYAYIHSPYQMNYLNGAYPLSPAGSAYPHAGGSSYPPVVASMKSFGSPFPQYKPGAVAGNAPRSAVAAGYRSYATTPSGYTTTPSVTAANSTTYDDVSGSLYKESNMYVSSQQGEGWMQQLSRDMGATALQPNSYYSLQGQGQHTPYTHTQQPAHAHAHPGAAFTSIYHPSQSGPSPSAHQLLQQPQTLGGGSAGATQVAAYQQPQRAQQAWNGNY